MASTPHKDPPPMYHTCCYCGRCTYNDGRGDKTCCLRCEYRGDSDDDDDVCKAATPPAETAKAAAAPASSVPEHTTDPAPATDTQPPPPAAETGSAATDAMDSAPGILHLAAAFCLCALLTAAMVWHQARTALNPTPLFIGIGAYFCGVTATWLHHRIIGLPEPTPEDAQLLTWTRALPAHVASWTSVRYDRIRSTITSALVDVPLEVWVQRATAIALGGSCSWFLFGAAVLATGLASPHGRFMDIWLWWPLCCGILLVVSGVSVVAGLLFCHLLKALWTGKLFLRQAPNRPTSSYPASICGIPISHIRPFTRFGPPMVEQLDRELLRRSPNVDRPPPPSPYDWQTSRRRY